VLFYYLERIPLRRHRRCFVVPLKVVLDGSSASELVHVGVSDSEYSREYLVLSHYRRLSSAETLLRGIHERRCLLANVTLNDF